MDARTRYCQRASCGQQQRLAEYDQPRPCAKCGGVNFDLTPPRHSRGFYELTDDDRVFLRVQGIDPEGD